MVLPIVPLVLIGSIIADSLVNAYATYDSTKSSDKSLDASYNYIASSFRENEKFWEDYYKNTGKRPLYPYRSGAVNDVSQLYSIDSALNMNKNARLQSIANIGASGAYGYGLYDSKTYHLRKQKRITSDIRYFGR